MKSSLFTVIESLFPQAYPWKHAGDFPMPQPEHPGGEDGKVLRNRLISRFEFPKILGFQRGMKLVFRCIQSISRWEVK
jgi:hypothetical protein